MADTDQLSSEDVQALHELKAHLSSTGDPRAAKIDKYLSASGAPVSAGGARPAVNMEETHPFQKVLGAPGPEFPMPAWLPPAAAVATLGESAATAPLQSLMGAATGFGGRHVAKRLGASEPVADAVGALTGLAGGMGANKLGKAAAEMSPELARIIPGGRLMRYLGGRMNPTPAPPMAGPVREPGAPAPGLPPMTRAADIAPRPAPEPIMPEPTGERAAPLPIKAPAKPGPAARMGARGTGGDFMASPRIAPPAPAAPRMAGPVSRETPITPKPTTDIAPGEAPQIGPPTPEQMAAPFQSDEAKANAFNARKDLSGAAKHMGNRKNAAQVIADYAKSKGYDDPEVMQAATNEHWKAVAKAAGKPDVSDQTIAAAKAILKKK
jgi:hypothetical protein